MEKTTAQIRRELIELEHEHQRLLDETRSKPSKLGLETLKRGLMMSADRTKLIRDLEKRIKGLRAKLS